MGLVIGENSTIISHTPMGRFAFAPAANVHDFLPFIRSRPDLLSTLRSDDESELSLVEERGKYILKNVPMAVKTIGSAGSCGFINSFPLSLLDSPGCLDPDCVEKQVKLI